MAIIQSGASADLWTIDATSKAGRATLYDAAGNALIPAPSGSFMLPINVRQTAASAAASTVWTVRNGASKTMRLRRLFAAVVFDGTAAAATTLKYALQRFSAATPTGGTALTAVKKRTTYSASTIADARFLDTGLTTTGVTFETDAAILPIAVSVTAQTAVMDVYFERTAELHSTFELAANEGLALRLNTAAVIGMGIDGFLEWDELP